MKTTNFVLEEVKSKLEEGFAMVVLPKWTKVLFGKEVAFIVDYDEEVEAGDVVDVELDVNYYLIFAETLTEAQEKLENRTCKNEWYDYLAHWSDVVPSGPFSEKQKCLASVIPNLTSELEIVDYVQSLTVQALSQVLSLAIGYEIGDLQESACGFWNDEVGQDFGAETWKEWKDAERVNEKNEVLWYWEQSEMQELLIEAIYSLKVCVVDDTEVSF